MENLKEDTTVNKEVGQQTVRQIVTNGPDFNTPLDYDDVDYLFPESELPKGYQSTASVELIFYENGQEVKPDQVRWAIERVQNKALAWNREPGALTGLAWGDSEVDGATDWKATPIIGGPSITTSSGLVMLTDVVGERVVILKAETTINGRFYKETIEVSFGKGPLSVFSKPPSPTGLRWATAMGMKATKDEGKPKIGDFTATSTTFPAAKFCGGTVFNGSSDITIKGRGPDKYFSDFSGGVNSGHWRCSDTDPDGDFYYSITSKLPTLGQLLAVAAFKEGFSDEINRKGVALAAGWPDDDEKKGRYQYWTGQVGFYPTGIFGAIIVHLENGCDIWDNQIIYGSPIAVGVS
jgi:hypothetical protein